MSSDLAALLSGRIESNIQVQTLCFGSVDSQPRSSGWI